MKKKTKVKLYISLKLYPPIYCMTVYKTFHVYYLKNLQNLFKNSYDLHYVSVGNSLILLKFKIFC